MAQQLHEVAVDAQANLEALATGLAKAGADDSTLKAVTQMADTTRKIVKALGKGQELTGDTEGPAEDAAPSEEPETMDSATGALAAAMARPR